MQTNHPHIYNLEVDDALAAFQATRDGLSGQEVAARQQEYGLNALRPKRESMLKRLIEPFANAFVLVLLFALVLSLFEGAAVDAAIIAVIVGVNAIIYYFQQYSVGKVLADAGKVKVLLV